jgi:predicted membrane protein
MSEESPRLTRPLWAGLLSMAMAVAITVLVLVVPRAIATGPGEVNHGLLALVMWGMAAGYTHGVGFIPVNRVLRVALGPWVGWPLMALGIVWFARGAL